jgi:hypothetical protein
LHGVLRPIEKVLSERIIDTKRTRCRVKAVSGFFYSIAFFDTHKLGTDNQALPGTSYRMAGGESKGGITAIFYNAPVVLFDREGPFYLIKVHTTIVLSMDSDSVTLKYTNWTEKMSPSLVLNRGSRAAPNSFD